MRRPRVMAAPMPKAEPRSGPPWHQGRSFYTCGRCSAQDERTKEHLAHPLALDCWNCGSPGGMLQWTPPAVRLDREASHAG